MRPRRIRGLADKVFRLTGGTEDNDLFVSLIEPSEDYPTGAVTSYWKLDADELELLKRNGGYLELTVLSVPPPPVAMRAVELEVPIEPPRFEP